MLTQKMAAVYIKNCRGGGAGGGGAGGGGEVGNRKFHVKVCLYLVPFWFYGTTFVQQTLITSFRGLNMNFIHMRPI